MKEIQLILAHNVFANVGKCLRVFSRLISGFESTFRFSVLNASVGATNIVIPGGPERSAGSLGAAVNKRVLAACSKPELKRRQHYFLRDSSNWWNRIIKDKQCLETFECLTMTRS